MIHRTPRERRIHRSSSDLLELRAMAETVPCPYCGQPAERTCVNVKYGGLYYGPAHSDRITAAAAQQQAQPVPTPGSSVSAGSLNEFWPVDRRAPVE